MEGRGGEARGSMSSVFVCVLKGEKGKEGLKKADLRRGEV